MKNWGCKELINESIQLFRKNGIEEPRLNAELIMAHCMNTDRIELYSNYVKKMTRIETNYFRNLVQRRLQHEPVQYIIGKTEFMSLPFIINRDALIPRPETEILVEKVLNQVLENRKKQYSILDMGTGSGNIIVSLAKYAPGRRYYASDISKGALRLAKRNAKLNRIRDDIHFIAGEGFSVFRNRRMFDCIVSNPPYIPTEEIAELQKEVCDFEPGRALDGGPDGLDHIRNIIDNAHRHLRKDGMLALEFMDGQSRRIRSYALKAGKYKCITIVKDLSGKDRIILMKKK